MLPSEAVAQQYRDGKTDEFLSPMVFAEYDAQRIRDGDVVVFFNFRADRARQFSRAFLHEDFDGLRPGRLAEGALRDVDGIRRDLHLPDRFSDGWN